MNIKDGIKQFGDFDFFGNLLSKRSWMEEDSMDGISPIIEFCIGGDMIAHHGFKDMVNGEIIDGYTLCGSSKLEQVEILKDISNLFSAAAYTMENITDIELILLDVLSQGFKVKDNLMVYIEEVSLDRDLEIFDLFEYNIDLRANAEVISLSDHLEEVASFLLS